MRGVRAWKKRKLEIIWYAVFIATIAFLLWKCSYGYAFSDEAFYLTIPWRMSLGDGLFLQEWHPSQLSSFLLYPLVKGHLALTGSTEGMILRFRILFTLIWGGAAYFFYRRLRHFSLAGAMAGSLMFLAYTPFGIMALSYNSLGILMMVSAGVMVAANTSRRPGWNLAGGILFAGAVLCCPFLVIVYVVGTAVILVRGVRKKENRLREWACFSAGCGILLLLLLIYLLRRGTPGEYLRMLPEVMQDPEHPPLDIWEKVTGYLASLLTANAMVIPCLLAAAACWLFLRGRRPEISFALVCCLSGLVLLFFRGSYYNNVMLALSLAGWYCGMSGKGKELKRVFLWIFLPGAAYTFCLYLSSNQQLYAISSAATVMTVSSPVLMLLYLREIRKKADGTLRWQRIAAGACALLIVSQLAWEYRLRYSMVFGESGMEGLTVRVEEGLEKGLRTTPEQAESAKMMAADAAVIQEWPEAANLLVLDPDGPPIYLSAEKKIAAYSAWLAGLDEGTLQRLDRYEQMNPDKQPDLVYVTEENAAWAEEYLNRGYQKQKLPSGAWLLCR